MTRTRFLFALISAAVLFGAGTGLADSDHDAARRAVERGEIRPLAEILSSLRDRIGGDIVGVELEREHGRWVYEIKALDARGRRVKYYVDARTGDILGGEKGKR
ncbi:MAG: peptidase [Rhodospirillales bacterium]|nr:peptidase [Rhodospirillales bacterium]